MIVLWMSAGGNDWALLFQSFLRLRGYLCTYAPKVLGKVSILFPLSVLRSLVRQVSTATRNPGAIRETVQDLYHRMRLKGAELTYDTCRRQLLEAVNLYERTTLVLDALDECNPQSGSRIAETTKFLLSNSQKPVKVFVSSRPDRDIRKAFRNFANIEILAKAC